MVDEGLDELQGRGRRKPSGEVERSPDGPNKVSSAVLGPH